MLCSLRVSSPLRQLQPNPTVGGSGPGRRAQAGARPAAPSGSWWGAPRWFLIDVKSTQRRLTVHCTGFPFRDM